MKQVHPMAMDQLRQYQLLVPTWPLYTLGNDHRCGICNQNIWFTLDRLGNIYQYTTEEIEALIVAHIRQVHPEATDAH